MELEDMEDGIQREIEYFQRMEDTRDANNMTTGNDFAWAGEETSYYAGDAAMQRVSLRTPLVAEEGLSQDDLANIGLAVEKAKNLFAPGSVGSPSLVLLRDMKKEAFRRKGLGLDDKLETKQLTCVMGRQTSVHDAVVTPKRPVDYALFMGRSFRVGWTRDGRFVHSGGAAFTDDSGPMPGHVSVESIASASVSVSSQTPLTSFPSSSSAVAAPVTSDENLLSSLRTFLRFARHGQTPGAAAPHWRAPSGDPAQEEEYRDFVRLLKDLSRELQQRAPPPSCLPQETTLLDPFWALWQTVNLVDAMVGQETHFVDRHPKYTFMPLCCNGGGGGGGTRNGGNTIASERRRAMIGRWLSDVSKAALQPPADQSVYRHIFDDLASGQVGTAMDRAAEHDLFRLASVISQATTDMYARSFLENQVHHWCEHGGFDDSDLMDVYSLLVGFMGTIQCLGDHSWLRVLAAIFQFRVGGGLTEDGDDDGPCRPLELHEAFGYYNIHRDEGHVRLPESAGGFRYGGANVHILYSMLGALIADEPTSMHTHVLHSLESGAFTPVPLDYSGPHVTQTLLQSLGKSSNDGIHAAITRQHIISQLLCRGEWAMACFVAMHIEDASLRDASTRAIVLQWADLRVVDDEQVRVARDALHVPVAWFHEATALACAHDHDTLAQAEHLSHCAPALRRHISRLIVTDLFPRVDLREHGTMLRRLIEASASAAGEAAVGAAASPWSRACETLRAFLDLCDADDAASDNRGALSDRAEHLLERLQSLRLWTPNAPLLDLAAHKRGRARLQEMGERVRNIMFCVPASTPTPTHFTPAVGITDDEESAALARFLVRWQNHATPLPLARAAQLDELAALNRTFLRSELEA